MTLYQPSPIRRRRTAAEMEDLRAAIVTVLGGYHPMTVRQLYYQLVSRGVIAKTEAAYKALDRLLTKMRRNMEVPFRMADRQHALDT